MVHVDIAIRNNKSWQIVAENTPQRELHNAFHDAKKMGMGQYL